jgi:hypothetical protein
LGEERSCSRNASFASKASRRCRKAQHASARAAGVPVVVGALLAIKKGLAACEKLEKPSSCALSPKPVRTSTSASSTSSSRRSRGQACDGDAHVFSGDARQDAAASSSDCEDAVRMNALSRLIERARLRNAPPQVQEGYELYRARPMAAWSSATQHSTPYRTIRRSVACCVQCAPPIARILNGSISCRARSAHTTPNSNASANSSGRSPRGVSCGRPREAKTPASRTDTPQLPPVPRRRAPVAADAQGGRLIRSRFPAGHDALRSEPRAPRLASLYRGARI